MFKALLRTLCILAASTIGVGTAFAAYPDRPITIVVPYTPGGTVDLLARLIGPELTKAWGQQVVVDNRPGAGGSVGAEFVAKAPNDGYTLLMSTNSPLTTNLFLYPSLHYDTLRDFEPVVRAGEDGSVIVANPSLPVKTFADLIALAKKEPGTLLCGTSGNGTTTHVTLAEINKRAGVAITPVPYAGGVPSLTAAVSGEVQITISDIVPALPLIRDGRLKVLATTTAQRAQVAPDIPTIAESGIPGFTGFNIVSWTGIVAPKGTPAAIIAKLNTEINQLLKVPAIRDQMIALGIDPVEENTPAEFLTFLEQDIPLWKQILVDSGAKIE